MGSFVLTCLFIFVNISFVSICAKHKNISFKGRSASQAQFNKEHLHMPIAVEFVSSRRKKIAVDVVPAEWQLYIAH